MSLNENELEPGLYEYDLVVFSQFRWNSELQRQQEILSKLAKNHRVLFIEEPISKSDVYGDVTTYTPKPNIVVAQPHVDQLRDTSVFASIVSGLQSKVLSRPSVIWTDSPDFVDVISLLSPKALVYDCINDLGTMSNREKQLLAHSSLVFTNRVFLYDLIRRVHTNTHYFPNSVDSKHFLKSISADTRIPADIKRIRQPIVGYYGGIDDSLDFELIGKLSLALPRYSFVLIGSVATIDSSRLPKAPNIYYLPQKPYELLPSYLKAFDVAMLPMALNDATNSITPTKTLEFMAAKKVIVSTSIPDIESLYSDVVAVAASPKSFAQKIELLLSETTKSRAQRLRREYQIVWNNSWDKMAIEMEALIQRSLSPMAKPEYRRPINSQQVIAVPHK